METNNRKIAAILAADVVEYSRLMGADEPATLAALKIRRALFDRLVQEFGGQEFGSVGDSLMAQFPSAINAVRCARDLQHAIAVENDSLPSDRRMALRIGVNLGDVIEENGVLFGDGVNIAARLQSMAAPGGVLVSGAVYEQVKNKLSVNFTFIGARSVKNIVDPVPCYELAQPVAARSDRSRAVALVSKRQRQAASVACRTHPHCAAGGSGRRDLLALPRDRGVAGDGASSRCTFLDGEHKQNAYRTGLRLRSCRSTASAAVRRTVTSPMA